MARGRSLAPRFAFAALAVVAIVAMHGSGVAAHACETSDHPIETPGDHHHHGDQPPTDASGTAQVHCGALTCTAIVGPGSERLTTQGPGALVRPEADGPLTGTLAAPDPPVPRPSLHR